MNIDEQIEIFYKEFPYSKNYVGDGFCLYSLKSKEQAATVCKEAILLIQKLNLPLQVEWLSNSALFCKTVLIKGI